MKRPHEYPEMCREAAIARVGADRMAAGLPCIPDPGRGDLAVVERLRAELFKIQCQQLRVATATDMTRLAMREAAMDTRNEIIKVLAGEQKADAPK